MNTNAAIESPHPIPGGRHECFPGVLEHNGTVEMFVPGFLAQHAEPRLSFGVLPVPSAASHDRALQAVARNPSARRRWQRQEWFEWARPLARIAVTLRATAGGWKFHHATKEPDFL